MSDTNHRSEFGLAHLENGFADVTDSVHGYAYYAQTDNLQAAFYPPRDFSLSAIGCSHSGMEISRIVAELLAQKHWTQQKLADHFRVSQSTVYRWKTGAEPEGHHRDAIRSLYQSEFGSVEEDHGTDVPLMGYIGAGAVIEPDFEQVPANGLEQIHVPFPMPADMIAFGVKGDSMLPVYKDGAVVIAYREQRRPLTSFFGEDAAVRTRDGRRFIKTIMRGSEGFVNLFSWNAAPIENVHLEWIGEIFAVLPPRGLQKPVKQGGIQGQLKLGT